MDASRFDTVIRAIPGDWSRRGLLPRLAAVVFGLGFAGRAPAVTNARKRKKRKKRKRVTFNAFGCVDAGRFCQHPAQCCSSICQGQPGQKRCQAHDSGGCQAGQQDAICGGADLTCTTSSGLAGTCETTTGNAGYCARDRDCFACTKDAECVPFCGAGAGCVVCAGFCGATGNTACVSPNDCDIPP